MPDFCLCLSDGNNRFLQILLVNDGGHRTRSFLEFLFGLFPTCKGTYFLNSNGVRIDIGGKYFSEIVKFFHYSKVNIFFILCPMYCVWGKRKWQLNYSNILFFMLPHSTNVEMPC